MAEIIDFKDRRKREEDSLKRAETTKKRELIRRFFQCARCVSKCAMCGTHPESEELRQVGPFCLCEPCFDDYEDYKLHLTGTPPQDCWWHNLQWLEMWRSWLDFQKSLDNYRRSKEFLKLLREITDV